MAQDPQTKDGKGTMSPIAPDDIKRPIWLADDQRTVQIIDQRRLPHELVVVDLNRVEDVVTAIKEMYVRGAPLIGVTGAYGIYIAARQALEHRHPETEFTALCAEIENARPTAVNLRWAVQRLLGAVEGRQMPEIVKMAKIMAGDIAEEEVENCRLIGQHGLSILRSIYERKSGRGPINVLTHCNAGWLACVEYGTATAPIYAAAEDGMAIHVWVDETRPLNQGARLTAWELWQRNIAHTVITDNAGGHLMQHNMVDVVIVGTDRTTHTGDVANKIGTYLKALAAKDNRIPFYVALPSSTFDWQLTDGIQQIPIELRDPSEVKTVTGWGEGHIAHVRITPERSEAANFAFDVTPARLVTGFITERGVCRPTKSDILGLFPEKTAKES
jgi:methylthioribose-1-phosphate isomerase